MTKRRPNSAARSVSRQERGAHTRAAILQAAVAIFSESGYGGARTDAIAGRAGVNKALLYYYFKSKAGLYAAILEDQLKEFSRRATEALSAEGSSTSKLLRYVGAHFDFISQRPYYPRLIQQLVMTGGKPLERLLREFFVPLHRKLRSVVERGVREGEFRALDTQHAVLSLAAVIIFYFISAPVWSVVTHTDPYQKTHLARRRKEVVKFIRYAFLRDGKDVKA
ncbi:MAG TPA: TetR/AcrR family transcriptional regulator [Terriglobia bacterium]|nr:TetR/AcrR family transcriptional regulator [Terriglobia bacterium]